MNDYDPIAGAPPWRGDPDPADRLPGVERRRRVLASVLLAAAAVAGAACVVADVWLI